MENVVIGVAIVQMQEVVGPGLVCMYPPDLPLETYTVLQHSLVELLLPSSANTTSDDVIRLVTKERKLSDGVSPSRVSNNDLPDSPTHSVKHQRQSSPVFIAGAFHASREADGCRGTRQATVCLVMRFPLYKDMLLPLTDAAQLYATGKVEGPEICFALYNSLRRASGPVSIAGIPGKSYTITPLAVDDSVYKCLKRECDVMFTLGYGEDIVLPIWRAIAQHRSIVVVADTVEEVSRFILGCVILVSPMKVPLESLQLYVSSPSMVEQVSVDREKGNFVILGTTNDYFAVKQELGDVIVTLSDKKAWLRPEAQKYVTPAVNDKEMFQKLQAGIKEGKGEDWVRLVLERHTTLFIQSLPFLEAMLHREEVRRLKHLSPRQMKCVVCAVIIVVIGIAVIIALTVSHPWAP